MKWKKFLSAFLIGAVITGTPLLAQTVSANSSFQPLGYGLFVQKKAQLEAELNRTKLNVEKARADYEKAKRNYERAVKDGKHSKTELKKLEKDYQQAKENYERAKKTEEAIKEEIRRLDEAENSHPTPKFNGLG